MVPPYVKLRRGYCCDTMHGNTKRTHLDDSSVYSKVSAVTPATTHEDTTLVHQLPIKYELKVHYGVQNPCGRCYRAQTLLVTLKSFITRVTKQ
jgi:bacterioferritin-associated ferredoxin